MPLSYTNFTIQFIKQTTNLLLYKSHRTYIRCDILWKKRLEKSEQGFNNVDSIIGMYFYSNLYQDDEFLFLSSR